MELTERKWIVYLHTNKINDKQYVGVTCQNPKLRWANGKGYDKTTYFGRAIRKYGWENFNHEILEQELTFKEAGEKEKYYIKTLNTQRPNGYNIQNGGFKDNIPPHMIQKAAEINGVKVICIETNEVYPSYCKAAEAMNVNHKAIERACKETYFTSCGYHWMKYDEYLKYGFNKEFNPNQKQVICYETKKVYENAFSAAKELGYPKLSIWAVCNKRTNSYKKQHWFYYDEYLANNGEMELPPIKLAKRSVKCVETGEIFSSLKEAGRKYGVSNGSISFACKNPNRKCVGYHWQYIE